MARGVNCDAAIEISIVLPRAAQVGRINEIAPILVQLGYEHIFNALEGPLEGTRSGWEVRRVRGPRHVGTPLRVDGDASAKYWLIELTSEICGVDQGAAAT